MLRPLILKTVGRLGYRLTRVPPDNYRLNPRFDQNEFQNTLAVIKRITESNGSEMPWPNARNYLQPRRASFYYDVLDALEAASAPLDGSRVLDVGVFFGEMVRLLHKYHPTGSYFGTETNATRIKIASELCPTAKIWSGTIDTLELGQTYDMVLVTEVLEHLADPEAALHKLMSVTDRCLLLTVPDGRYDTMAAREFRPEWGGYTGHVNFWSLESWRHWLGRELPGCQITADKLPTGQLIGIIKKPVPSRK